MSSKPLTLASVAAAAVAAIGLGGPARADQLADIMERKELRCGTFADVPPFAAPDPRTREMVGFDIDLCHAIARRWGVAARVTPLSVEARVPEVKLGRVDLTIANLAYTLGRAEQIQFSDPLKMIEEPMAVQPIGIGMRRDEPALLAKVNETLRAMDEDGEINLAWDKWLGPQTEYKMTRTDRVVPLSELKFDPLP